MKPGYAIGCLLAVLSFSEARATVLELSNGERVNGAVWRVSDESLAFVVSRERDQPADIRRGDAEDLFRAQGHGFSRQEYSWSQVRTVDGLAPDRWVVLYRYNLPYRLFEGFDAGRIVTLSSGNFLEQIRSLLIFLALLFVGLPLVLMLVSWPFSGERLTFLEGIGVVVVLSAVGFGLSWLGRWLAGTGGFAATAGAQVGLTAVVAVLFALLVQWGTRFKVVHGFLFVIVWGAGLFFVTRIVARLAGVNEPVTESALVSLIHFG